MRHNEAFVTFSSEGSLTNIDVKIYYVAYTLVQGKIINEIRYTVEYAMYHVMNCVTSHYFHVL